MKKFSKKIQISMGDCDAAGMAYYPRYTEMVSKVIEDWFTTALSYSFHQLHQIDDYAIPTVDIRIEFFNPSRLSETLDFELCLTLLKERSFTFKITAEHQGQPRIKATSSLVFCKNNEETGLKSFEIPDVLRGKMQHYLED